MKAEMRPKAVIWILIMSTILTACSGISFGAEPTTDPNIVYTEVAATVMAQLTSTEESSSPEVAVTMEIEPLSTVLPTEEPTATPLADEPTLTPAPVQLTPSSTYIPSTATPSPTATLVPYATPTRAAGDAALWVYQSPADHTKFSVGEDFLLYFGIMNVGNTIWKKDEYKVVFQSGTPITGVTEYPLEKDVNPGEKIEIYIAGRAPDQKGEHINRWYLLNKAGIGFYEIYFAFEVE
jgi:hypothetical protein